MGKRKTKGVDPEVAKMKADGRRNKALKEAMEAETVEPAG